MTIKLFIMKTLKTIADALAFDSNLVHAAKIQSLYSKSESKQAIKALDDISTHYVHYLNANLAISGYKNKAISKRVALLNEYYNFFYDNKNFLSFFNAQTKLRSTILEEFLYLLFRDYINEIREKIQDTEGVIRHGSATAYTNLYFYSKNFESFVDNVYTGINEKDQDYTIYRALDVNINGSDLEEPINIPVVAIECKTYLDRTMLEGAVATANEIKSGSPYSNFYVVTEQYNVDKSVDPSYSRIKQIYVLRKEARKKNKKPSPVYEDVVIKMFSEIVHEIEKPWSNVEEKMINDGVIMGFLLFDGNGSFGS